MDPALLKQRQEFMQHAIRSMDTMQQIKKDGIPAQSSSSQAQLAQRKKKKKVATTAPAAVKKEQSSVAELQTAANFSVMAKIVDYMRKRHLNQQQWPLSLQEIMDEMQIYDVNRKSTLWLQEALPHNPRLQSEPDGKFNFKPPHRVKNKATMLTLLRKQHSDGKGGILLSELNECVANAETIAKSLGNQIIGLPTQINKRKDTVYFFNDPETDFTIDEQFVQLWRVAGVEHLDENKIEEYLQKHGLDTARDLTPRKAMNANAPKRKQPRQRGQQRVHNVHLEDMLEDYAAD